MTNIFLHKGGCITMKDFMKKAMLLKMLIELEDENPIEEFDEEVSDILLSYEFKLIGVLYCLIRFEKKKPGFTHHVPILDMCTKPNKMFMAHILHLFHEFGIIETNDDKTEVSMRRDSNLVLALLEDENVSNLFEELYSLDDVDDSSCQDDDTEYGKCSLKDIFDQLGGF